MWDVAFIYNTERIPRAVSPASRQPRYFNEMQHEGNNLELVSKTTKFNL